MEETVSLAIQSEVMNCDLIAPWYAPVEHLCFGTGAGASPNRISESRGRRSQRVVVRRRGWPLPGCVAAIQSCGAGDRDRRQQKDDAGGWPARRRHGSGFPGASLVTLRRDRRVSSARFLRLDRDQLFLRLLLDAGRERYSRPYRRIGLRLARNGLSQSSRSPPIRYSPLDRRIIRSLYAAFWVTTGLRTNRLPDYRSALAAAGFELQSEEYACGGLLVSELWQRG